MKTQVTHDSAAPRRRRMAALLLGLASPVLVASALSHQRIGELNYELLPEASGMAISAIDPQRLWFINDRGNRAEIIALDLPDFEHTSVAVTGARNTDWEDLEGFVVDGDSWLAIADIGDNVAEREKVAVHLLREPSTDTDSIEIQQTLRFTYPGGPRDAESLAVDPVSRHIYILSKREKPPVLFRVALPPSDATGVIDVELERLGEVTSIPAPAAIEVRLFPRYGKYRNQPTAISLGPDGKTIALMTYGEAYVAKLDDDRDWLAALNRPLCALGSPLLAQPETIAVDNAGAVYVSSERKKAPLIRITPECDPLAID
ncbi:MAG: hypothetical protein AAGL69_13520 [Pseudomonadota bacterium]